MNFIIFSLFLLAFILSRQCYDELCFKIITLCTNLSSMQFHDFFCNG